MSSSRSLVSRVADSVLEATIVGSFTTAGFRARSSLDDWDQPPRMDGQHVIVTGSTSGIGRATAAGLLRLGATVLITSRSLSRAEDAAEELMKEIPDSDVLPFALDTGDFASIQAFADDVRAAASTVDVLIHNAGALTSDYATDDRGTELTLSTHLIGPYLLTTLLKDDMADGGRVLWMSSGGMYSQRLDVDHLEMTESKYRGAVAYARAKRAQVELVRHLAPSWAPGVVMHAMHPGWVDTPGVDAGLPGFGKIMGPTLRTAEEGADTMVWLAATGGEPASPEPGLFWLDRRPRGISYLPGTSATERERRNLVDWLDLRILPATVASLD